MNLFLAWRPFLDPMQLHGWWWAFLVPLSLGISVAYKAVRVGDLRDYWRQVAMMTVQIILGMVLLGVAAFVILGYVVPAIVPMDR
ncbi:MAG: hypothetical protein WD749_06245 [Phycisphaerales bacterium]